MRINIFLFLFIGLIGGEFQYNDTLLKYDHISFIHKSNTEQSINDSLILWSASKKLIWDDFQGKPDEKSRYKALTFVTVQLKPIIFNKNTIIYEIPCWFERTLSWSKVKNSNILLNHEQLHYDIAEYVTRKFRKKLSNSNPTDLNEAKILILKYFDEEEKERANLNNQYDKETNHSINKENQKKWEIKIAKELKILEQYANTRVTIKRVKK